MFKLAQLALPLCIAVSAFSPRVSFSQAIPQINIIRSNVSCQGVGRPVTKARLQEVGNEIKAAGGILVVPENVPATVENAFEVFSVASINARTYRQAEYSEAKKGFVEPDAIGDVLVTIFGGNPPQIIDIAVWLDSAFVEAKTTQGNLNPSDGSSDNQILGLIDVTSNNTPAGEIGDKEPLSRRPIPQLIFLTVRDTVLTNLTRDVATDFKVALYQSFLCEKNNGVLGVNEFQMGTAITLNSLSVAAPGQPKPLPLPAGSEGSIGFIPRREEPQDNCTINSDGTLNCSSMDINRDTSEMLSFSELERHFDNLMTMTKFM